MPKVKAEIGITTFEADQTNPLEGHPKCGYAGQLEVIQTVKGKKKV